MDSPRSDSAIDGRENARREFLKRASLVVSGAQAATVVPSILSLVSAAPAIQKANTSLTTTPVFVETAGVNSSSASRAVEGVSAKTLRQPRSNGVLRRVKPSVLRSHREALQEKRAHLDQHIESKYDLCAARSVLSSS